MASIKQATIYANEAMLLRWGDSANGRTVTLQLFDEDGEHPFKAYASGKNGQRVMIAVTLIGDDEQPASPEDARRDKTPADKAIAKAHILADNPEFQKWIGATPFVLADDHSGPLGAIRKRCGVQSTTEFRTNPEALKRFNDLVWSYEHREMIR